MMFIDLSQVFYILLLLLTGLGILYIRRRAEGSKSLYKITLMLAGFVAAIFLSSQYKIIKLDPVFLEYFSIMMMVVLMFELSIRMNQENITLRWHNIKLFFMVLLGNIFILSPVAIILMNINGLHAIVFAIIMSTIEYFFVEELREEGDLANPLIVLFTFSILFFNSLKDEAILNIASFIQNILIGVGAGIIAGIIIFKLLRGIKITWFHETILVFVALITYFITEQLNGSGLFAILIVGIFFGNSYIRQSGTMKSFSPFIFKTLEILIFLLLGFVVIPEFYSTMIAGSIILFLTYIIIRLIIISIIYPHYSIKNKLLLVAAPKGIVYASLLLTLGASRMLTPLLINTLFLIIIYSLIIAIIFEYIENRKIARIEHVFNIIKNLRYGRKKYFRSQKTRYKPL